MDSDDVYAFDNTVVHKTGNETINGTKTFTGDGGIMKIQNTYVTYDTAPSSDESTGIVFTDKNGTHMGVTECYRFTDNSTATQLNVYGSNGNWSSQPLQLRVFSDGYSSAYAPTPYVNADGNEIATAAYVKNVLSSLYPVGSIYIGTQNTCPLASLISGSQWQLVAQDRALWGGNGSNGNTTIAAGLPNITGNIGVSEWGESITSGAFRHNGAQLRKADWDGGASTFTFDGSRSNSIYGQSSTDQPPAYRVNVWRRTA
jgi:hypothetical protein